MPPEGRPFILCRHFRSKPGNPSKTALFRSIR
uniref:Uncharacterized protein n=1 Tax=Magnetospirillum gryphiswaldense TaxID=55518 RepID=A4TYH0_9PROT|nr:hypothetical protein MGR_3400 [Magnetospirillum gryphiswaldense MSR-1]